MDLAHRLIDTLADKWKPEEFRDIYTEVLRKAIEAKVEGREFELPAEERPRPVTNLMKALEQSLARKEPDPRAPEELCGVRHPRSFARKAGVRREPFRTLLAPLHKRQGRTADGGRGAQAEARLRGSALHEGAT